MGQHMTSGMGRLDAIADAETLRLFMKDGRHFFGLTYEECPGWTLGIFDLGSGVRKAIRLGHHNVAARRAQLAARAAMSYVPDLKG